MLEDIPYDEDLFFKYFEKFMGFTISKEDREELKLECNILEIPFLDIYLQTEMYCDHKGNWIGKHFGGYVGCPPDKYCPHSGQWNASGMEVPYVVILVPNYQGDDKQHIIPKKLTDLLMANIKHIDALELQQWDDMLRCAFSKRKK